MEQTEFLEWIEFFKLFPFDDYARYYRPAALIGASVGGADVYDLLDWLERRPPATSGFSEADIATMKTFGIKPPQKQTAAEEKATGKRRKRGEARVDTLQKAGL